MRRTNEGTRRAVAIGVLGALAVPAFLLGAGLADPGPAETHLAAPNRAPGRAAADTQHPARSNAMSPAADSAPRPAAEAPRTAEPSGLTVTVTTSDRTPVAGEDVRIRIRWSDGSGRYAGLTEDWGDGTATSSLRAVSCVGAPGAHGGELESVHRFPAGRFRVRMSVTTADCSGRTETRTGDLTLSVEQPPAEAEAEVTESPSATPEPEPSETPSEAPSETPTPLIRTAEADRTDSDTP
ncbi:hypothetical protein [Cryptosporangium phraense]|uniref:PKD domain-containing protein n=1 Tax=Cryptosporangium phraense TaxID=2593070 RepID=A0A545AL15_9ACTN|nr:hypothetical protein [Cryptosporangium phraense]TQS41425.1 hypothetical protein FL583_29395 [Cryptosporangium phraense]